MLRIVRIFREKVKCYLNAVQERRGQELPGKYGGSPKPVPSPRGDLNAAEMKAYPQCAPQRFSRPRQGYGPALIQPLSGRTGGPSGGLQSVVAVLEGDYRAMTNLPIASADTGPSLPCARATMR